MAQNLLQRLSEISCFSEDLNFDVIKVVLRIETPNQMQL